MRSHLKQPVWLALHDRPRILFRREDQLIVVDVPDRRLRLEQRGGWVNEDGLIRLESFVAVSASAQLGTVVKVAR